MQKQPTIKRNNYTGFPDEAFNPVFCFIRQNWAWQSSQENFIQMERDAWKSKGYKSKWRRASWNGETGPFFLAKVKKVIREEEWQLRLILLQRAVCSPAKGKSPALTMISSRNALSIYVTDRHLWSSSPTPAVNMRGGACQLLLVRAALPTTSPEEKIPPWCSRGGTDMSVLQLYTSHKGTIKPTLTVPIGIIGVRIFLPTPLYLLTLSIPVT